MTGAKFYLDLEIWSRVECIRKDLRSEKSKSSRQRSVTEWQKGGWESLFFNRSGSFPTSFLALRPLNRIVNFSSMDGNFTWSFNAKPYFVATNFHNDDSDVVVDDDALVFLAGEY